MSSNHLGALYAQLKAIDSGLQSETQAQILQELKKLVDEGYVTAPTMSGTVPHPGGAAPPGSGFKICKECKQLVLQKTP